VGLIYRSQVGGKGVETRESGKQIMLDEVPIPFEESRAETIWARARVVIHREEGIPGFFQGEGADERSSMGGVKRGGLD
jgi:hypothetical protein